MKTGRNGEYTANYDRRNEALCGATCFVLLHTEPLPITYVEEDVMDHAQMAQMKDFIQLAYEAKTGALHDTMDDMAAAVSHIEETLRANGILESPPILDQTQNMKDAIRGACETRIGELHDEMKEVISALTRAERTLFTSMAPQPQPSGPAQTPVTPESEAATQSAATRLTSALETMIGEFTSREFWDAANKDGHGAAITRAAFMTFLSRLVKNRQIVVVRTHNGNVPGLYRKPA